MSTILLFLLYSISYLIFHTHTHACVLANYAFIHSQIKRYKVIENLLESEAAFLTSLNIAIEVRKINYYTHN